MRILSRLSPRVRKVVDWIVGLALLLLGLVGLVMPVLQGWLFILAGLAVLSSHSRWAHLIYEKLKSMGRKVRDRVVSRRDRSKAPAVRGPDPSSVDPRSTHRTPPRSSDG